jgi:1,4-alpha-glucan branching enzyme
LVKDLNHFYRDCQALYEIDFSAEGFEWIDHSDSEQGVIAFIRRGLNREQLIIAVCNMTPVIRENYRIGVPRAGCYQEKINSDASLYGGSGVGNLDRVQSEPISTHGRTHSLNLILPPLATLILTVE